MPEQIVLKALSNEDCKALVAGDEVYVIHRGQAELVTITENHFGRGRNIIRYQSKDYGWSSELFIGPGALVEEQERLFRVGQPDDPQAVLVDVVGDWGSHASVQIFVEGMSPDDLRDKIEIFLKKIGARPGRGVTIRPVPDQWVMVRDGFGRSDKAWVGPYLAAETVYQGFTNGYETAEARRP